MADVLHRLVAYSTAPETYDPPSPAECAAAAAEIKRLRAALLSAMDFVNDAANGHLVTVNKVDGAARETQALACAALAQYGDI